MTELGNVLLDFFKRRHIVYYLFFIILYRFAEGFVMKIVPLFLKASRETGGLGLSEKEIGLILWYLWRGSVVLGSLLAGYYISARGLKRSLFSLCCIFNLPFMVYAFFAFYSLKAALLSAAVSCLSTSNGFGFVGITLFMMRSGSRKASMAHCAFASGIMNLGVMLPGMLSGWVCEQLGMWFNKPGGYEPFFIFGTFRYNTSFLDYLFCSV